MPTPVVKLYSIDGCLPCEMIKEAHEQDLVEVSGLEDFGITPVDIDSEEGFAEFESLDPAPDSLPAAYYNGEKCDIYETVTEDGDEGFLISCPSLLDTSDSFLEPGSDSRPHDEAPSE